ncbi:SOUL domain-containing protein [Cephalotus follicularis]|uniref:SOUL domain-containing protein n=1 Tax=Cephalotus follicularis TaxID=3775 RepID=A0A1Q3BCC9_CEPFO|nr:SOUL domain-containing protein [Cephalotus follicularis]
MGTVLGKIDVEAPKYEMIQSSPDYEIRKYPPTVIAEVTYDPSDYKGDKDGGFALLAEYIGVSGKPKNIKPEKIAMTAPVITKSSDSKKIAMTAPVITKSSESEKIAMTVPVVTKSGEGEEKKTVTMQFLLPSKYRKAEEAPKPVDERVVITEEGERKYGVVKFAGIATDKVVKEKEAKLKRSLERDGYKVIGKFVLARYNPPWCVPAFRTNELRLLI